LATFHDIEIPDDPEANWDGPGLPPGVARAVILLGLVAALLPIPYALSEIVPLQPPCSAEVNIEQPDAEPACCAKRCLLGMDVEEMVVWRPGDPLPFSQAFGFSAESQEADAKLARAEALDDSETLAKVASLVVHTAPAPAPPADPIPASARGGDAGAPAVAAAEVPARLAAPTITIPPAAYDGVTATIEDEGGAMTPFYEALKQTALKKGKTRVSHWGDSVIAADGLTHMTRRLLQMAFGDAGHGFIMVDSGTEWYRQKDVRWQSRGWKTANVIKKQARDGHYGYGGVSSRGYAGAWATFGTSNKGPVGGSVSTFHIYHAKQPKQGRLELRMDGGDPTMVDMSADTLTDAVHVVEVPDGAHKLKIRAIEGGVRVYGVAMERDVPGVVYDGIGMVGARLRRLLNADPEHWKRQLDARAPDLLILMFGGNSLSDKTSIARYEAGYRDAVKRFRTSRPQAACLLMSPVDHGVKVRRRARTPDRLVEMIGAQRRVASSEGCAYWSAFDAMGGRDSMAGWVSKGLAEGDYAHLTRQGSMVLGELYFKAIMKGFADWLAQPAEAP
jgi:lysophospholipase L1-like esterase